MPIRNRIIAATMLSAMALPLMATTAAIAPPTAPAKSPFKAEQAERRNQDHERGVPAARRGDDCAAARMDGHHQQNKDREDD